MHAGAIPTSGWDAQYPDGSTSFFAASPRPGPRDVAAFKVYQQEVWYPNAQAVADIIMTKSHLLSEDEFEDHHFRLLAHYCARMLSLRVFVRLWDLQDAGMPLPEPFDEHFAQKFELFEFPLEVVNYFQDKRRKVRREWLRRVKGWHWELWERVRGKAPREAQRVAPHEEPRASQRALDVDSVKEE
jgi:hypothetical protein